ncbi:hypothetical protein GCM10007079_35420 [Nocardiopsis terrae]|nr:hypothetical protein GCM10007079_35420 [Nocardiopsis terrae]
MQTEWRRIGTRAHNRLGRAHALTRLERGSVDHGVAEIEVSGYIVSQGAVHRELISFGFSIA